MHTLEVFGLDAKDPKAGRAYTYPGSWTECTVQQLGAVAALTSVQLAVETPETRELAPADRQRMVEMAEAHLRLHLLRELTNMAGKVFERIDPADLLDLRIDEAGASRVALLPSLDWCLATPLFDTSIVPEVVVRKRRFIGPNDRLGRMVLLQWGFADTLLQRFGQSGSVKDLHLLLGALYHDPATPWSNHSIEERAEVLAQLDDRTKLAAVINYRGLRAWLAAKYKRCFAGGKADPHGVQGMVVRMAGPKFGTVEQVRHANLHDVMVHVEQSLLDREELERNTRK